MELSFLLGILRAAPLPLSPADRPFLPSQGQGWNSPLLDPSGPDRWADPELTLTQACVGGDSVGEEGKASIPLNTCQSRVPHILGPVPGVHRHVAGNMGFGVSKRPVQILPLPRTSCMNLGGCV